MRVCLRNGNNNQLYTRYKLVCRKFEFFIIQTKFISTNIIDTRMILINLINLERVYIFIKILSRFFIPIKEIHSSVFRKISNFYPQKILHFFHANERDTRRTSFCILYPSI